MCVKSILFSISGGSEDLMSKNSYMTDGEDTNDVALVTQGFSHALSGYKVCSLIIIKI